MSGQSAGTQYRIDPETLCAIAIDTAAMLQHAREVLARAESAAEDAAAARARSNAAIWFAIAGDVEQAHAHVQFALALQRKLHLLYDITVTEIRAAQVLQRQGELDAAHVLLAEVVARCRSNSLVADLLDFALQHLAKVQFERGQFDEALQTFREALILREEKGEADLIESTRLAIAAVDRRLKALGR